MSQNKEKIGETFFEEVKMSIKYFFQIKSNGHGYADDT